MRISICELQIHLRFVDREPVIFCLATIYTSTQTTSKQQSASEYTNPSDLRHDKQALLHFNPLDSFAHQSCTPHNYLIKARDQLTFHAQQFDLPRPLSRSIRRTERAGALGTDDSFIAGAATRQGSWTSRQPYPHIYLLLELPTACQASCSLRRWNKLRRCPRRIRNTAS